MMIEFVPSCVSHFRGLMHLLRLVNDTTPVAVTNTIWILSLGGATGDFLDSMAEDVVRRRLCAILNQTARPAVPPAAQPVPALQVALPQAPAEPEAAVGPPTPA
jgi:hypothetical protein